MTKAELEQKIKEGLTKLRRMLDDATLAKRDLTRQEALDYDTLDRQIQAWEVELRQLNEGREDTVYFADFNTRTQRDVELFRPARTWEEVWQRQPKPLSRKLSLGEIISGAHNNDIEKLRELRTMTEGSGTAGGFSVPEPLWARIYNSALETSVTMDRVTVFPMSSESLTIAAWDSEDHKTGPIGGVVGQWLGEAVAATRVTPSLRSLKLSAKKLAMFIGLSSEVLMDSVSLAQSIGPMMRNSLAWSIDDAIINGTGMNRPVGILNAPCRVVSTRTAAGAISLADLARMFGRLPSGSMERAVWLMSPSAFASLLAIETGGGQLILQSTPGATARTPMTLFGCPIRPTEKLPALGSLGDVVLADLSYYALGTRETGRFEQTISAQWTLDITDVRLVWRLDGMPLIDSAMAPASGGNTLSPFVVLAA